MGPDTPGPRQRFQTNAPSMHSESPFANPPSSFGPTPSLRQAHALEEHSFINETENQLDNFIAQGREVLDNLMEQRTILKGTQKRLLDAANTLGLSRNVIGWIEKRTWVTSWKEVAMNELTPDSGKRIPLFSSSGRCSRSSVFG